MSEALLVDLDGVLRHWDQSITSAAEARHGLPDGSILAAAFEPGLLSASITGEISDQEWRTRVAVVLEEEFGPAARRAVEAWSASTGAVDERVLEVIRRQRGTRRVALVTNATSRLAQDLEAAGLTEEFDEVFNSSELGVAKPDPQIYEVVCQSLGLAAAQCLYVDDSPANVRAAEAVGIRSHVFQHVEGLEEWLAGPERGRRLTIGDDDPACADVQALVEAHLAFARRHSPPEDVFAMEPTALASDGISFFSVREQGALLGIGALKRLDDGHAELKSIHTAEAARGRGVGRAMLAHLVGTARVRGYRRVSLETGTMAAMAPARALYASVGFQVCPPFGEYGPSPNSVCMTFEL